MVDSGFLRIHSDMNDYLWSLAASNNSGSGPGGELELVGTVRRGTQPSCELGGLQAIASGRAHTCLAPMNTLAFFDSHKLHRVRRAADRRCIINYLTRSIAELGSLILRRYPELACQAALCTNAEFRQEGCQLDLPSFLTEHNTLWSRADEDADLADGLLTGVKLESNYSEFTTDLSSLLGTFLLERVDQFLGPVGPTSLQTLPYLLSVPTVCPLCALSLVGPHQHPSLGWHRACQFSWY